MGKIKAGFVVYATDSTRDGVEDARAWLREKRLTPDQVRLYQHDGMTLVQAKVPIDIPPCEA